MNILQNVIRKLINGNVTNMTNHILNITKNSFIIELIN